MRYCFASLVLKPTLVYQHCLTKTIAQFTHNKMHAGLCLFQIEVLIAQTQRTYVCSSNSIHIRIRIRILIPFTCWLLHLHNIWFLVQMNYLSPISGIRSGFGALDKVYSTCQNSARRLPLDASQDPHSVSPGLSAEEETAWTGSHSCHKGAWHTHLSKWSHDIITWLWPAACLSTFPGTLHHWESFDQLGKVSLWSKR